MAKAKTTSIPTIKNWGDFDHRTYFKGKQIVKANKSTAIPKPGKTPACYYVNRNDNKGEWYYVTDVAVITKEDKEVLKSLQAHKKDLVKSFMSNAITNDQFMKRTEEVDEKIAELGS